LLAVGVAPITSRLTVQAAPRCSSLLINIVSPKESARGCEAPENT